MINMIYRNIFFYLTIFYILSSYFLFPYLSSQINPKYIFYLTNQYFYIIIFSIILFCIFYIIIDIILNKIFRDFQLKFIKQKNIIFAAYFLFFTALLSKFLNIMNGSVLNFAYGDIKSSLFYIEYLSSMNILSLLSLLFFIAGYYNKNKKRNIYLFLIPTIYFIFFLLFSHGGRINFIILILFIFLLEIYNFSNFKNYLLKFISFFIIFFIFFNILTVKKDATLLVYIGIHVVDLNKEVYFEDLDFKNKKIVDVILSKNLIFIKCKKNLEEYQDKSKYSKYDKCKRYGFNDYSVKNNKITQNLKIPNTNKLKEVTFNNTIEMNFINNLIYNLTTRLNNYQPLSGTLYLLNNDQVKERKILNEYKIIIYTYLNSIMKYINFKFDYKRNLEVDNFYLKSGIGNENYKLGVSPTLIGEMYWIGGYIFILIYTLKIALVTFIANRTFQSSNLFLKTVSFFFFIQYLSSFEQSFEAHTIIFLRNITIILFCFILYFFIDKFNFFLRIKNN